jgi:hypothetical protein
MTIRGSFPPSSSTNLLYPTRSAILFPALADPVNVTRSMFGSLIIASPIERGSPVTTDSISGGSPAS